MRHRVTWGLVAALLLAAQVAVGAQPDRVTVAIDPARSEVSFRSEATGHTFAGKTRRIEGTAALAPGGLLGVEGAMAGVEAASLSTGNGRRDRKMRALLDVERAPRIMFRATGFTPGRDSAAGEGAFRGVLAGVLTIRGVTRPVRFDVTGAWEGGTLRASGSGEIRLTDFGMKPPRALGFLRVKDLVRLEFDIVASPAPPVGR